MKLHIPLGLRKAVLVLVSAFSVCAAAADVVPLPDGVTSVDGADGKPCAISIASPSVEGEIMFIESGDGYAINMGGERVLEDTASSFTISIGQDTTIEAGPCALSYTMSHGEGIHKRMYITQSAGAQGSPLLTFSSQPLAATTCPPDNNIGVLSVAKVHLAVDVPTLFDANWASAVDGTAENSTLNMIEADTRAIINFNRDVTVRASASKSGGGSLHFTAVSASGYLDGSEIHGQKLVVDSLDLGCGATGGNVSAYGLFAHAALYDSGAGPTFSAPVTLHFEDEVAIGGASGAIGVSAANGRADFTGAYASEVANIELDKGFSVQGVVLDGSQKSTFTGMRVSTDSVIEVKGGVAIKDNRVEGEQDELYSLRADGGEMFLVGSDEKREIEGDMTASTGALYQLISDVSGTYANSYISGPTGELPYSTGAELYKEGGTIQASFAHQASYFSGFTQDGEASQDDAWRPTSQIHLSFTDGAAWNVVPSNRPAEQADGSYESRLTALHADNARVYVGSAAGDWVARNGGPAFSAGFERLKATDKPVVLTIGGLTGSGSTFYLRADIGQEKADRVVVTGNATGEHQLMVQAVDQGDKAKMDTALVQAAGDAAFTLANPDGQVEAGAHMYTLARREGAVEGTTEWFLQRAGGGNGRWGLSPTGEAVLAFSSPSAQVSFFQRHMSDLRGRLGEIRDAETEAPMPLDAMMFYAQAIAGHDTVPGFEGCDYRSNYWGAKVGFNRKVSKRWMVGAEFSTAQGKQRLERPLHLSKGESESYGLMLTGTWSDEKGRYCDIVFGLDCYRQDVMAWMKDGTAASGSYSSLSPALSVECGRKYLFGGSRSWFIEPQAQLIWYMAGGDGYTMSNGVRVDRDDAHSLTGRLGFALGKMHHLANGDHLQWHADAGVKHEFMDDPDVRVNGATYAGEGLGTRFYYGVGADWWLNSRSKLYGAVQREEGGHYKSELNARVGYSYSF